MVEGSNIITSWIASTFKKNKMGFKDNSDCGKSYFRGNAENNMTWDSME